MKYLRELFYLWLSAIILETEGSVRKIQKRAFPTRKKLKKGTPIFTSPHVHSLFTTVLIKQVFEKNKSSRAASGSRSLLNPKTQFTLELRISIFYDANAGNILMTSR